MTGKEMSIPSLEWIVLLLAVANLCYIFRWLSPQGEHQNCKCLPFVWVSPLLHTPVPNNLWNRPCISKLLTHIDSLETVNYNTYSVPATRVLTWVAFAGISFARPKSEILGVRSLSRRILLAFISLWMMGGLTSSWRKAIPRATPMHILHRVRQSK